MAQDRSIDLIDYLLIILKHKKLLLTLLISSFIIAFGIVYFFIDEQFDSTSVVLPSASSSSSLSSMASGMLKDLKDLPLGLGGSSKSVETDLYLTIVYSHTMLEDVIKRFDLMKDYHDKYMEEAIKDIQTKVSATVTPEKAFSLTVRANNRKKAVDINNYILTKLNERIIELNISKSRDNRIFLEQRYNDVRKNLKNAEDSLQIYQEQSGLFEAEDQMKLILDTYSKLETGVMSKQTEYEIMTKMYPSDSPVLKTAKEGLDEYKGQLEDLKKNGKKESIFLSYNSLPQRAKNYIRHYRDVKVYNSILEFILPMYEQAKYEEQKNLPVLQVIDKPSWPEKKAYPPRAIYSLLTALGVFLIAATSLIFRAHFSNSNNEKIIALKHALSFRR